MEPATMMMLASLASTGAGLAQGSKKAKVRLPTPKSTGQLVNEAVAEIPTVTKTIRDQGAEFINAQRYAQQQALPGYFEATRAGADAAMSLAGRIWADSPEQRMGVQAQRAGQAARGVALSPSSALAEGLQQAFSQIQFERGNIDLFGKAAGYEAATPYGVQALSAPGMSELLGVAQRQESQRMGIGAQAGLYNAGQEQARNAAIGGGLMKLGGGFAGAAGAESMGIPGYDAMAGFSYGMGVGPSPMTHSNIQFQDALKQYLTTPQQSNVGDL